MTPAKDSTKSKPKTTPRRSRPRVEDLPIAQEVLGAYAKDLAQVKPEHREATAVLIDVDKIDVPNTPAMQVPLDDAKVDDIARSVRASRQFEAIKVKQRPEGHYELVDGKHRIAAFRRLKLSQIRAHVEDDDDQTRATARAVRNLTRRAVRPYEEALHYKTLLDTGLDAEQVARRCGTTEAIVKDRLRLAVLPPDIGARIGEPGFGVAHAEHVLPLVGNEERAKQPKPTNRGRREHDWQFEQDVAAAVRAEVSEQWGGLVTRAAQSAVEFGPREHHLVLGALLANDRFDDQDFEILATASGLPNETLRKAIFKGGLSELVDQVVNGKDPAGLARLTVAAALVKVTSRWDGDRNKNAFMQAWCSTTPEALAKKVTPEITKQLKQQRKEAAAAAKAAKEMNKPNAKNRAKGKSPTAGVDDVAGDVAENEGADDDA